MSVQNEAKQTHKAENQANGKQRAKVRVAPALDVLESPEGYLVLGDLPDVANDAIEIQVEKGRLTLVATPTRGESEYHRVLGLSDDVDLSGISAELDAGVLRLTLPKRPETQPRKIAVNVV